MKNSRLSHRLITAFMFMALIVAISGAYGIATINRVGSKVQETLKSHAAQEKVVILMRVAMQESRIHLLEAALVRNGLDDFSQRRADYVAKRDLVRGYRGSPGLPEAESWPSVFMRFSRAGAASKKSPMSC
jgi:hypothetical protein